jgi:hypothetical protein
MTSFNPLKIVDTKPQNIIIYERDAFTIPGFEEKKTMELLYLNPEEATLLNTYDLRPFKNSS